MDKTKPKEDIRQRSYHHGDLKAALLAAATSLLEKAGPEALSFRAIAREVGVSQTAPYNHFAGKEHLLAMVAAAGFRAFAASQAEAAGHARTPARRVHALGRAYVAFARARPQLYRLMFGVGLAEWRAYPELVEAAEAAQRPIGEAIASQLAATGNAGGAATETAIVAAWSLVHGLAMLLIDGKIAPATEAESERLADRVTGLFVAALGKRS